MHADEENAVLQVDADSPALNVGPHDDGIVRTEGMTIPRNVWAPPPALLPMVEVVLRPQVSSLEMSAAWGLTMLSHTWSHASHLQEQ